MKTRPVVERLPIYLAAVLVSIATPLVQAGSGWSSGGMILNDKVRSDIEYARVIAVTPNIRTVQVSVPVRECREVSGYYVHTPQPSRQNTAPTVIAGGVIGGLVGNNIGSGSGRDAARIVGTLAGAAIASDIARERQQVTVTPTWVPGSTQCSTRQSLRTEERLDGYTVTYEHRGIQYTTSMREHPGTQIPVRVTVSPVL